MAAKKRAARKPARPKPSRPSPKRKAGSGRAPKKRAAAKRGAAPDADVVYSDVRREIRSRLLGGTENYVVTREFRSLSDRAERTRLLECLFAVAAADDTISGEESTEIAKIAEELGFTREEMIALRAPWLDKVSALRDLPKNG